MKVSDSGGYIIFSLLNNKTITIKRLLKNIAININ